MTAEVRLRLIAVGAVILFGSICYYVGKKDGRTDERLAINSVELKKSDSSIKSVQTRSDTAKKNAEILTAYRAKVREKVRVVHDTLYVQSDIPQSGADDTTSGVDIEAVYNPQIARLIAADDSVISAQKHALQMQDVLIASLRVGLNLRDTRIRILEQHVTPGKLKRIINATKWLVAGTVVGLAASHK